MRTAKTLIVQLSLVALIINGGAASRIRVKAASDEKQKKLASDSVNRVAAPALNDLDTSNSRVRGLIERYVADRGSLIRFYTVEQSAGRRARIRAFNLEWLGVLNKMDFNSLGQDEQVDYLLFKNYLDHEMRQLDIQSKQFDEVAALVPFARTIIELEEARRRMETIDSAKTAAALTQT
jgi:hypothetical protein